MNFGDTVKKEILNKPIKEDHCKRAFLAGIIRGSGTLFLEDEKVGIDFKVPDEETEIIVSEYLKTLFGYEVREVSVSEDRLNKKDKIVISIVGDKAEEIIYGLKILSEGENEEVSYDFYKEISKKDCCFRSFIKGLFISTGVCTVPSGKEKGNTGYHAELGFSHAEPATIISETLYKYGINTKITRRKENYIVYIKNAEGIKDFFAFLPVPVSVLKLTEIILNKEISNKTNRQTNCDLGNVNRQITASTRQIEAIKKIEKIAGLKSLKPDLLVVAKERLDNPDETLTELAERLNISKSCLNHRLRKIVSISQEKR